MRGAVGNFLHDLAGFQNFLEHAHVDLTRASGLFPCCRERGRGLQEGMVGLVCVLQRALWDLGLIVCVAFARTLLHSRGFTFGFASGP